MIKKMEIVEVPMDFYARAKSDPFSFITDVLGRPTVSIKKLFDNLELFNGCLINEPNPFDEKTITLSDWFKPSSSKVEYFIHLDGAEGGDGYGICMCHIHSWKKDKPPRPIVKLDFLGSPNKKTYGNDFDPKLVETLIEDVVFRGFKIKLLTFDRATNVRVIEEFLNSYGVITAPLSIDRTHNFPLIDYTKKDPPFFKKVSTNGYYDKPMTEFRDLVNDGRLLVPFYPPFFDIPYALEHNAAKKIVTKLASKEDDIAQAVAGALFNALNNATNYDQLSEEVKNSYEEFERYKPDGFETALAAIKRANNISKKKTDRKFDIADIEDENVGNTDSFTTDIRNPYYF